MSSSEDEVVSSEESEEETTQIMDESSSEEESDEESDEDSSTKADVSYDLGCLAAFSTESIDAKQLKQEDNLRELARAGTEKLIKEIFDLPTRVQQDQRGWIASLPSITTKLPREKPLPKKKAQTKWEKFAQTKGIQKRKRSKMEFDERTATYKRRFGYDKANDDSRDWAIEHTGKLEDEDGKVSDPWSQMKKDKKERVEKNKKQQKKNQQQAAPGSRVPGTLDLTSTIKAAPPKRAEKKSKKAKHHVDIALAVTQRSTASMGVHDKMRAAEPAVKKKRSAKRDSELERNIGEERKQSLKVLDKLLGPPTEREQTNFSSLKPKNRGKGGKGRGSKKGKKSGFGTKGKKRGR